MSELVRNPRILKKAQAEVRNVVIRKKRLTEDEIPQDGNKRLSDCTLLFRYCSQEKPCPISKINGFDVYPKTLIQINAWAIGRDPNYWNNPEEFFPERFAASPIDFKGQHFDLLPFGAGQRVCPGIHLPTTTMELLLANLLYCFDWKLPHGMKEEEINMEEAAGQRLDVHKKIPLELVLVNYLQ